MGPPVALITGVTGQDGIYLALLLQSRGYHVVGTTRQSNHPLHLYLRDVDLVLHDIRDGRQFAELLDRYEPDEIYNLAAFSSVGASWHQAELVGETNGMAVLRMLEQLRIFRDRTGWAPRFYQAATSEMFGLAENQPQNEVTPHHPRSPYAAAKSFAFHLTVNYRESYGLFACNGILYNHESPLRGAGFVTRKITRGVADILLGRTDHVTLGNLDVRRDWGAAYDYVTVMHDMLQQDEPADLIIATGHGRQLSEFLETAFDVAGLGASAPYVRQDESLMRLADIPELSGDATRAQDLLGWRPATSFRAMVEHMVEVDVRRARTGVPESDEYLYPQP